MSSSLPEKIFCVGCYLRCPGDSINLFENEPCGVKKTGIWPGINPFFIDSLYHLFANKRKLPADCLFIDFSRDNIAFFIDEEWLVALKKTGKRIVLLIDRFMKPLAQHWHDKHPDIALVPVTGKGIAPFLDNLDRFLNGENIVLKGVTAVTDNELFVLRKLIAGKSARSIAFILNCSLKNVYNCQYSLCKKLGDIPSIEKLVIKHFHLNR